MKEYFIGIITVVFCGGIINTLVPEGSAKKYMRLLCGLCVVSSIAFPIVDIFVWGDGNAQENAWESIFDVEEENKQYYDEIYNQSLISVSGKNASASLKSLIIKEFDAKDEDFDLNVITQEKSDEIFVSRVELIIYPSGILIDPHGIVSYVEELLGCSCEVIYKSE